MKIVVDNSVVLAWCMADESDARADSALEVVLARGGVVPRLWWYEVRNALIVNERRGRLTAAETTATLMDVRDLPLEVDDAHDETALLDLARRHQLSV